MQGNRTGDGEPGAWNSVGDTDGERRRKRERKQKDAWTKTFRFPLTRRTHQALRSALRG